MAEAELVKLATAANEVIAAMVVEALKEEGVPALARAKGAGIGGWASAALLEHDILVRAADKEKAQELVEPFLGQEVWLA